MARIPCPECKKQISESAESCPKCGYKLTSQKVAEIKQKQNIMQIGCTIALLVVCIPFMAYMYRCSNSSSQKTPTTRTSTPSYSNLKRIYEQSFATELSEFNRKYGDLSKQDTIAELKRKYIEAHKAYTETNDARKLDHAYIMLEIAMGTETYKGVTKQRRELEAFIDSVKRGKPPNIR